MKIKIRIKDFVTTEIFERLGYQYINDIPVLLRQYIPEEEMDMASLYKVAGLMIRMNNQYNRLPYAFTKIENDGNHRYLIFYLDEKYDLYAPDRELSFFCNEVKTLSKYEIFVGGEEKICC